MPWKADATGRLKGKSRRRSHRLSPQARGGASSNRGCRSQRSAPSWGSPLIRRRPPISCIGFTRRRSMCISTGRAARCEDGLDGSGLSLTTDAGAPWALWGACGGWWVGSLTLSWRRLPDWLVIIGRIELRAIGAPGPMFDSQVDVTQLVGRHAQGDHLADPHHHIPGDDLYPRRREVVAKPRAL